ncbi:xanthine dehydrogenase family protein molybdopterin-binding subunit [Streptomyces sp. CA-132043]|uniref:xanthine dehydrogenase family protein molybdopterin-binding subunit n=1 Tax=Streptomyces sp. CA-132043 TaxID=3240048 RepID=UPI003D94ACD0
MTPRSVPLSPGPSAPDARFRVDAVAKVTGSARYTADHTAPDVRHAVLVTASVPAGRITELHTTAAEKLPGVVAVLSHRNAPKLHPVTAGMYPHGLLPLQEDRIHYEGEPVALVVAEAWEQAVAAAHRVRVRYTVQPAVTTLDEAAPEAYPPTPLPRWGPADTEVGDLQEGLAAATTIIESSYSTASRHHNAMEPAATLARYADGKLTVHDASQGVFNVQTVLACALDMEPEDIRVLSPFTGGGFGSKGYTWPHEIIVAMAARHLGGTVLLALNRAQSFTSHGYQPQTRQTITLGAKADGSLTALRHTSLSPTSLYGEYVEMAATCSRTAYACPAISTAHRVAPVAAILPTPMRAPHEGPGMFALESAMDELAHELRIDPLELRRRNHALTDPTSGKPFSSKELLACYATGARRFGWDERPMAPRSMRAGRELIGWGMAGATMNQFRFPAAARIRIQPRGDVLVEAGTQEIGTGTYTVLGQIAAQTLGCAAELVQVRLGDTELPRTGMTAGSSTTLSVGSAVRAAARNALMQLAQLATGAQTETANGVRLADGHVHFTDSATEPVAVAELLQRHGLPELAAEGEWTPQNDALSLHTFGAVFAEVAVDEDLCVPRVRRVVAAYSAGRIINPLTARSQMTGGIAWGIGQALLEQSVTDAALGRFVSKDLSGYLLPVHADVPELDVVFVDEFDEQASTIGARGTGELGAVGVSAAIANAVFHATGTRPRSLPITPEALLTAER